MGTEGHQKAGGKKVPQGKKKQLNGRVSQQEEGANKRTQKSPDKELLKRRKQTVRGGTPAAGSKRGNRGKVFIVLKRVIRGKKGKRISCPAAPKKTLVLFWGLGPGGGPDILCPRKQRCPRRGGKRGRIKPQSFWKRKCKATVNKKKV